MKRSPISERFVFTRDSRQLVLMGGPQAKRGIDVRVVDPTDDAKANSVFAIADALPSRVKPKENPGNSINRGSACSSRNGAWRRLRQRIGELRAVGKPQRGPNDGERDNDHPETWSGDKCPDYRAGENTERNQ